MSKQDDVMVAGIAKEAEVSEETVRRILRAYQSRTPMFDVGELIASGLNGFAFELAVETVRTFEMFEEVGPIAFRMRGVRFVIDYDPESEAFERRKREGMGLPADNPKYTERHPLPEPSVS